MSWKTVELGNLCDVLDSKRKPITKRNRIKGNFPYYGATGIVDYVGNYIFDEKLVLIGEDGAKWDSGERTAFIADGKYWVNNHAHVLKPNRDLLLDEWLVYYFFYKDLKEFVTGLTVPKLNQGQLRIIPIPLPSVLTQKKLVAKLDAIFAEIDKATQAADANAKNAEALFSSYLNKLFNEDLVNLKKYKLGEICTFQGGSQPPKSFFQYEPNKDNIRFIQIRDYKNDKNIVFIPKKLAKRFCDETEVMIGRYGPPVFQILKGINGSYNVALMKAIPNEKLLTKDYLFYFLKNPMIQDYVISLSNRAAGQSGMNKETIEPYEIYLPTIEEQNLAVKKIESCYRHSVTITKNSNLKIESLNFLKKSILKQAFNGELVKE